MIPGGLVLDARTVSGHFPGIGRVVLGLAGALSRLGPATILHARHPDPRLPIPPLAGVPCEAGPFALRQQWEVPRRLRQAGARIYHSPYYLMPYRPGVPAVVTCFDLIPMLTPGAFGPARRFAYVMAHRLAFRASAIVCVPSESTRRDVARLFPAARGKLTVVRPGVTWGQRQPERPAAPSAAAPGAPAPGQWGCPRSVLPPRFLLQVGSNRPHKGLDVLLRAWALALAEAPKRTAGITLVLAGPRDPRYPEPARSIERLGLSMRVADLGPVGDSQLDELYASALLFLCPSLREGFGLPLAEAMARGCPCVSSDTPALAETAGGAAALFSTGNAEALSAAILRLLSDEDEARHLGSLASARAACFDWDVAAREMAAVYARAAS